MSDFDKDNKAENGARQKVMSSMRPSDDLPRPDSATCWADVLTAVGDASPDAVIGLSRLGIVKTWNSGARKIFGYAAGEIVGRPLSVLWPSDQTATVEQIMDTINQGMRFMRSATPLRGKNGAVIPSSLTIAPVRNQDGQITAAVAIGRSIDPTRDRVHKGLAAALEDIKEGVMVLDARAERILYVNKAFINWTGYTRGEMVGREVTVFIDALSGRPENGVGRALLRSGLINVNNRKGGRQEVETLVRPFRDQTGRVVGHYSIARDSSRETELENQLHQSRKMEAIGRLAGGIAHDFNNLLWAITGYAEMTLDEVPGEGEAHDNLEQLLQAARRAKDLVARILTFSRQGSQEKETLSMGEVALEAMSLIRASIPTTIKIEKNLDADNCLVWANAVQIHQVLMNLCSNAAHAMRATGGTLKVNLEEIGVDAQLAAWNPELKVGSYVRLSVADDGPGIPPSIRERIFEPFFTTKNPVEGTGMGLATVHGIVKGHGGAVVLDTEVGKGSVFQVYLPRVEGRLPVEKEDSPHCLKGNERVLLVDDENMIVAMGTQMLERLGYEVVSSNDSQEALEKFKGEPDQFDLIITDQTMPGMTGLELAGRVLAIRPDIPVILCTGYSETVTEEQARAVGVRAFVPKPMVMDEMARMIRTALDNDC